MKLHAEQDLAMILPIPVKQPAADDAVSFIDLSGYKDFFSDLEKAFPKVLALAANFSRGKALPKSENLVVHRVGAFDASFVPNTAGFSRLDARFRLDDSVWKSLPQYKDFGFAVFKLRKGNQQVHPMAFRFPTSMPGRIFFPTVHIHDGKVHEKEEFDHSLYAQAWTNAVIKGRQWEESEKNAGQFVDLKKAKDLVWGGGHLYKRNITGMEKNEDVIAVAGKLG